jgi:hypothetical protein
MEISLRSSLVPDLCFADVKPHTNAKKAMTKRNLLARTSSICIMWVWHVGVACGHPGNRLLCQRAVVLYSTFLESPSHGNLTAAKVCYHTLFYP